MIEFPFKAIILSFCHEVKPEQSKQAFSIMEACYPESQSYIDIIFVCNSKQRGGCLGSSVCASHEA
jgi:hypothetical protein